MRYLLVLTTLLAGGLANAQDLPALAPAEPDKVSESSSGIVMNNRRLGRLLSKHFRGLEVEGGPGGWRIALPEPIEPPAAETEAIGQTPDQPDQPDQPAAAPGATDHLPAVVIVLTDERADRMRIMMPIRPFNPEEMDDLRLALIALHANYDRALDSRYAVQDGVLWSVFIHPLGSLTPADLENALKQVQSLRDNTGTSYSSSELLFAPRVEEPEGSDASESDDAGPDDPSRA